MREILLLGAMKVMNRSHIPFGLKKRYKTLVSQSQTHIGWLGRSAAVLSALLQEFETDIVIKLILTPILVATVSVSLLFGATKKPSTHRITFTFDYDFRITPACSAKVTQECVQQFNLYEISPGISNRRKLGSIPAPAGATGYVTGISVTTKPFLWLPGKHRLAVSAQMPNGLESDLNKCTTMIKIR